MTTKKFRSKPPTKPTKLAPPPPPNITLRSKYYDNDKLKYDPALYESLRAKIEILDRYKEGIDLDTNVNAFLQLFSSLPYHQLLES